MRNFAITAVLFVSLTTANTGWTQEASGSLGLTTNGSASTESSQAPGLDTEVPPNTSATPTPYAAAAPAPAPYDAAPPQTDSAPNSYPKWSMAIKINRFTQPVDLGGRSYSSIPTTNYPTLLEGALNLSSKFELFVGMGTFIYHEKQEFNAENDDDDIEIKKNLGTFILQTGARFNLMEPRARHAHLFASGDIAWVIGIGSVDDKKADNKKNDDDTAAIRELMDELVISGALGIEYLVSEEFGIGVEFGLHWRFNNLKKAYGLDHDTAVIFTSSFGLRFAYHF